MLTLTLTLLCAIVAIVTVVVVANSNNTQDENDNDNETQEVHNNETINIYDEMIKIIHKNDTYYDKFSKNIFFSQKNKLPIQSKYTASLPIPIPIPYKKN